MRSQAVLRRECALKHITIIILLLGLLLHNADCKPSTPMEDPRTNKGSLNIILLPLLVEFVLSVFYLRGALRLGRNY